MKCELRFPAHACTCVYAAMGLEEVDPEAVS